MRAPDTEALFESQLTNLKVNNTIQWQLVASHPGLQQIVILKVVAYWDTQLPL